MTVSLKLDGLLGLARRYCTLIEGSGPDNDHWLREVAELLPRLHASIMSALEPGERDEPTIGVDLDARFELYTHLHGLLGERDAYWLEFDRDSDGADMTGSLADDLTDIYCELKHGLKFVHEHPEQALHGWLSGFESHWERHLLDAERQLSQLQMQGKL